MARRTSGRCRLDAVWRSRALQGLTLPAAMLCAAMLLLGPARADERAGLGSAAGWRTDGTGRYPDARPPQSWSSDENVVWKTPLPDRSHAAPIVVGDRIFVTAEPAELLCIDAADGRVLWQASHNYADIFDAGKVAEIESHYEQAEALRQQIRELRKELDALKNDPAAADEALQAVEARIEKLQDQRRAVSQYPAPVKGANGNTTSTPVSDGRHVYAVFGTGIVACHTVEGQRKWVKWYEPNRSNFGHASSPLLADGKLIVNLVALHALDAATGEQVWSAQTGAKWGTPVLVEVDGTSVVVTASGSVVRLSDGEVLATRLFSLGHSSPVAHEGIVYVMEEGRTRGLRLKLDGEGRVAAEADWEAATTRERRFASPLFHAGLLYGVSERGILDVIDAESGKVLYRKRLAVGNGRVYPSPAMAGDLIFLASNNGTTLVVEPGATYRQVASNVVDGFSHAPVFAGERLYLRTSGYLYCVGK